MSLSGISLTSGMRSSLLSLQGVSKSIDHTQERLSTGRKVNSALDNPTNFFAAQAHTNRASDLDGRKDGIREAIQQLFAANNGITAISSLLGAAKGLGNAALATSDQTSRNALSLQFDEILNQIDTLADDSSYRGTNLLKSDTLTVNFSESTGTSALNITGVDASSSGLGVHKAASGTGGIITDTSIVAPPPDYEEGPTVFSVDHDTSGITAVNFGSVSLTLGDGTGPNQYSVLDFDHITLHKFTRTGDPLTITYAPGTTAFTSMFFTTTVAPGGNSWTSTSGIESSMHQVESAITTMRSTAKASPAPATY